MRESQKLNLTELRLKFKHLFQLATFCTARNLLAFSSRIETLDLCYKGTIKILIYFMFCFQVQTADLGEYFKDFNPVSCEWCDGKSANIVWGLDASAAKAMCYLSRPIGK